MKNKSNQRLALLLTVLMLLSLAACGGKPADGNGGYRRPPTQKTTWPPLTTA